LHYLHIFLHLLHYFNERLVIYIAFNSLIFQSIHFSHCTFASI
jgi:hypothetical protein